MKEFVSAFVQARLRGRDTLRGALSNSFWLFCDQLLRMAAGLLVGVWTARFLGPTAYGWFSYAIATVGIASSLTSFGISAIVVREVARTPAETAAWMGAALFLRMTGAVLAFLACAILIIQGAGPGTATSTLTLVLASGLLFQALDVVDLLFQARGLSRVGVWVRMSACLFGSGLRVALILREAPVVAFAIAGVAELAWAAAGWWWAARRQRCGLSSWTFERKRIFSLLKESWPLAVSGLAISAQAHADQVIIGTMLGAQELGYYAAAMRLVGAFAFLPMIVHTVSAPEIARAKRDDETLYRRRLHSLYRLMFILFLVVALPLMLLGPMMTEMLYGPAYAGAGALLPWLAFRLFFTNFGVARSVFLTIEGLLHFSLVTAVLGAVLNIVLNFLLIPAWGAKGAIAASMISFGLTTFGCEAWHPRARANLWLMARAIVSPWRRFAA